MLNYDKQPIQDSVSPEHKNVHYMLLYRVIFKMPRQVTEELKLLRCGTSKCFCVPTVWRSASESDGGQENSGLVITVTTKDITPVVSYGEQQDVARCTAYISQRSQHHVSP